MFSNEHLEKLLEERKRLAESRGFTLEYQQEKIENTVCHPRIAPATEEKYERAVTNWALWRLSRSEPKDANLTREDPDPTPQQLKLFAESYVVSRKTKPSQKSACNNFTCFTTKWERGTSRTLPLGLKKDVLNYIRTVLAERHSLPTKPRERFLVTAKDIDLLLHHLFGEDDHDYVHERARVQTASSLALFSGSAARAGAIVESSSYRKTNECLYYKHLTFNLKWSGDAGGLKRWVVIDPEFLKGLRYRDDKMIPKNWFREHPVLGKSFVFWVIVHGIADGAFKGISTVEELLEKRPAKGRESWTLEWKEDAKELPFFRMTTSQGPKANEADRLRVHGIRGAMANKIDPKATAATRGQALDHMDHDSYLKYQSSLKAVDMMALYYDLDPDYECREMEQSMAHHRDQNVPLRLDAASLAEFEKDEEVILINQRISELTQEIRGRPDKHADLVSEGSKLYTKKAKKLRTKRSEFIENWWNVCYDEYITGNDFLERDTTCLFQIYRKYMPERARLHDNIFKQVPLDSDLGRQCLRDAVSLCTSVEKVAYYPGTTPVKGKCPICAKQMPRLYSRGAGS
ncbi:hypothetical protein BBP40_003426 [Aspergillus hancockii]|nr:hypothetical protein BBP40_003426 [Aspergillus hancockii]